MWMKFVDKLLIVLLPHLSCMLVKIAKHLRNRYGVCEICDNCFCSKGEVDET